MRKACLRGTLVSLRLRFDQALEHVLHQYCSTIQSWNLCANEETLTLRSDRNRGSIELDRVFVAPSTIPRFAKHRKTGRFHSQWTSLVANVFATPPYCSIQVMGPASQHERGRTQAKREDEDLPELSVSELGWYRRSGSGGQDRPRRLLSSHCPCHPEDLHPLACSNLIQSKAYNLHTRFVALN